MEIMLVITFVSLLLFAANAIGRILGTERHTEPQLTVAQIQARLAAEPPRMYVPISRGW